MALIDEYQFSAQAGKGGDGVVRWTREKFRPKGGPCGGNGGKGGNVYVTGVRDVLMLNRIVNKHSYHAEPGNPGEGNSKTGKDGEDLYIRLPIGSVIKNTDTGDTLELLEDEASVLLLKGGIGGVGNEHFKSSTNQSPMQATKGKDGEQGPFTVELKLIADIGLVGLPNAGKSSLLNALTNASAKVGAYPFTTLDPSLGVYHKHVLADIPGLIEGAAKGKGLGHKFLKHISRTSVILHCISLEQENIVEAYDVVRGELDAFGGLNDQRELVVLTKNDLVDNVTARDTTKTLVEERHVNVLTTVTMLDDASVKDLGDNIIAALTK